MPDIDIAKKFFDAYRSCYNRPKDIRVFIIGEDHFLRVIDGRHIWTEYSKEYGYAEIDKLDRGKILSAFAKLEFLVNECINLYFLSAESSKTKHLSSLVRKLPFRQRIEAISEFDIINSSLEKKLKKLSSTRNTLAHEWDENTAKYDGGYLFDNECFEKFKQALVSSFRNLVDKYKKLQLDTNYLRYLDRLILEMKDNSHE